MHLKIPHGHALKTLMCTPSSTGYNQSVSHIQAKANLPEMGTGDCLVNYTSGDYGYKVKAAKSSLI